MKAQLLFLADSRPANVWFCGECRIVHRSEEMADKCCAPVICKCGATVQEKYWTACEKCRKASVVAKESERFNAAEKVTEWSGWVYCEGTGSDGYSRSIGELMDYCEEEGIPTPEYAWACDENHFAVVSTDCIKDLLECRESYEGFSASDMDGWEELEVALNAFNAKNEGVVSYSPNYRKAVIIQKGTNNEPRD